MQRAAQDDPYDSADHAAASGTHIEWVDVDMSTEINDASLPHTDGFIVVEDVRKSEISEALRRLFSVDFFLRSRGA